MHEQADLRSQNCSSRHSIRLVLDEPLARSLRKVPRSLTKGWIGKQIESSLGFQNEEAAASSAFFRKTGPLPIRDEPSGLAAEVNDFLEGLKTAVERKLR